jgi:hypothetical protein
LEVMLKVHDPALANLAAESESYAGIATAETDEF